MKDSRRLLKRLLLTLLIVAGLSSLWIYSPWRREPVAISPGDDPALADLMREASHEDVVQACASCHGFPPPDAFPKADWPREVARGFEFLGKAGRSSAKAPFAGVVAYYRNRAPDALAPIAAIEPASPLSVRFRPFDYRPAGEDLAPAIANVRFVHLTDDRRLDVVACDMIHGKVLLLKPYEASPQIRVLSETISNPAHAEAVDLDGDGLKDLLIANLGTPIPSEKRAGGVVWLRARSDGSFVPISLAEELGRVADVQAADFDGDGDLDLIVAEFGRLTIGSILLLENRTIDPEAPVFVRSTIDPRHGAIQVPVADLNRDGRPDFVAVISQEHETVVAFLNAGDRKFTPQVLFKAPHPAFGSSGIELVDLDRDGDLDVLMTNGDTLDADLLRPYHGIQWLENRGTDPFESHRLASMYGVHRALAADLDRDGDLDIVATSFMPGAFYRPLCRELGLGSIVVLEQASPGKFEMHPIETRTCDHASCDVGDFDGDGLIDIVTGNFFLPGPEAPEENRLAPWIVIKKNAGRD